MSRASVARLVLLATIWGSSFLLIKLALEGMTPTQVVLGRLSAGAAVLLMIVALTRQRLPREPVVWAHLALMGVVANIIPFWLFGFGEQRITSGLAGVLNGTTPLFTLAVALLALPEERWSRTRGAGLLLGFCGVVLVVGPWDTNPLTSSLPGQLACLGASACYGVAFVYMRRFLAGRGYPPLALAAGQMGVAAVELWLVAPLVGRGAIAWTPTVIGSVLILGAVGTGLAYLLNYRLIADVGATSASMVTYLIPIVAVALGVVALDEPLTWNLFVGAAVVIAGVMLAEGRLGSLGGGPPPGSTVEPAAAAAAGPAAPGAAAPGPRPRARRR